MQASEFIKHSSQIQSWMVWILLPLVTLVMSYLIQRLLHKAALQWVRFRSAQSVTQTYNPDRTLRIEAQTCTALMNADQIAAQLCTPVEYLQWINPQQALQKMVSTHTLYCEETIDALMDSTYPSVWAAIPNPLKSQCYAHGQRYLTPFLDDVIDDLIEHADQLFDFKETIRSQLKRQEIDQARDFLNCLDTNRQALIRHQTSWMLALSPMLALVLLSFIPTLSTAIINAPRLFQVAFVFSLSCGSLFLATLLANRNLLPTRKDTNHHNPTNPNPNPKNEALPFYFAKPAKALSHTLTVTLLDISSQIASLKCAPKRPLLEKIVARRFKQWFIDTLPTIGLREHFTHGDFTHLLTAEASFQCIQAMDRPFDDPDFITYCNIRIEQTLHERLTVLSSTQFSNLLTTAQSHYRTGWLLLLLSVMSLTSATLWLS